MVPMRYCKKDKRVLSVMLEVNRKLYINESTGEKGPGFDGTRAFVEALLKEIVNYMELQ